MPNNKADKIKEEIMQKVVEYYKVSFEKRDIFIPGQSKINYAGRVFNEEELKFLIDSSLEFWLTEGKYTNRFQTEFASFIGVDYCTVTNSGSSANLLAISALTSQKLDDDKRIKPGDEIITVASGFPTTIYPIFQNNAKPVFIDIELNYYNIDTSKMEDALTSKTKAVFLAHTLGNPFDITEVKKFCEKNGLWLIEDNCDALGSLYEGKYTGSFGDISTCSFYPAHHITMGEGGALLTNNPKLNTIIKSMREWGRDCWCAPGHDNTCNKRFKWQLGDLPYGYDHKYTYSEFGYNLKITDMQAAVGLAQMKKLPSFIEARIRNHKRLYNGLRKFRDKIILPEPQKNSKPSWFGFLITLKDNCDLDRAQLIRNLEDYKIQTRLLFAGNIIRQPVFDEIRGNNSKYKIIENLQNTDKVMNDSFWVGVYPGMSIEKIDFIIERISELLS